MNKLKLIIDDLRVDSFEASRMDEGPRGTVCAHEWTQFDPTCGGLSCDVACRTRYGSTCVTGCLE
ncbi:MAG TPA: hypothetical protein VM890_13175 [Longimicrobium sp.]|jgi:hypothetical protein|nr:hypothetical protein [Longimicrobium sp.]